MTFCLVDSASTSIFTFNTDTVQFDEGQAYCQNIGGQVATIASSAENSVASEACGTSKCWIDLHKSGNVWAWADGTPATYTNWSPGNPSGDGTCVELFSDGTWNDLNCDAHDRATLCETHQNSGPVPWIVELRFPTLSSRWVLGVAVMLVVLLLVNLWRLTCSGCGRKERKYAKVAFTDSEEFTEHEAEAEPINVEEL